MSRKSLSRHTAGVLALGIAIALCFAALPYTARAQGSTNEAALRAFSVRKKQEARWFRNLGAQWAVASDTPVQWEDARGRIFELWGVRGRKPSFWTTTASEAADTISTDEVYPGGSAGLNLTGIGMSMSIWEVGAAPLAAHPELTGRLAQRDGQVTVGNHATQVAGIMISSGINAAAQGMSYQGMLDAYDATDDLAEAASAAASGMLISNHSYAFVHGWFFNFRNDNLWAWLGDTSISETEDSYFGFYDDTSRDWDVICFDAPFYLPVFPTANWRGVGPATQPVTHWILEPPNFNTWIQVNTVRDINGGALGFDTLATGGPTSKNGLSVGAVNPIVGGYTNPASVVLYAPSGTGPTDDGRIKPDVVGDGVNVLSTLADGTYGALTGTSACGPNVAGSLALLQQHYKATHFNQEMTAAALKAVVIHTADEAGLADGPDYTFGWGLMNTKNAALTIGQSVTKDTTLRNVALGSGETYRYSVRSDGTKPLKLTMAWTDPAGTPPTPAVDPTDSMLVNDLDLRVYRSGTTYAPWRLDGQSPASPATKGDNAADNVEQIVIPTPQAGIYTIEVTHKGAQLQPNDEQTFALVVTGDLGEVKPIMQSITISPTTLKGGLSANGKIKITEPAPYGGFSIEMSSTDEEVAFVDNILTIPEGAIEANFTVDTFPVVDDTDVDISGTGGVNTVTQTIRVLAPVIQYVTANPWNLPGGQSSIGTVILDGVVTGGEIQVDLSTNDPDVIVPSFIVVEDGTAEAEFDIETKPVSVVKNVTITARTGTVSTTTTITLNPSNLKSFTIVPARLRGGLRTTGIVRIDGPAPTGGQVIQISSSDTSLATVPASVTIRSGQTYARVLITTKKVTTTRTVNVTATMGGASMTKTVTLRK